jgi:hypothetical protein
LIGLREQHAIGKFPVDMLAQFANEVVGFGEILAIRAFALVEVRNRVEPQAVHPHRHPEIDGSEQLRVDKRIVEIQVWLMSVKSVPVVGLGQRVPGPVGSLEILEDDARIPVFARIVGPDIQVALRRTLRRPPRPLEPGVLIGGVIENQLGDDPQTTFMSQVKEGAEVFQRAIARVDGKVVGNVIAIVLKRRRIEGQQPQRRDSQFGEVIKPVDQPTEIADAVTITILKRLDVQLVNDSALEPKGIGHCRVFTYPARFLRAWEWKAPSGRRRASFSYSYSFSFSGREFSVGGKEKEKEQE